MKREHVRGAVGSLVYFAGLLRGHGRDASKAEAREVIEHAEPLLDAFAPVIERVGKRAAGPGPAPSSLCGAEGICVLPAGHVQQGREWHQDTHGTLFRDEDPRR